jgi:hypothetical protein
MRESGNETFLNLMHSYHVMSSHVISCHKQGYQNRHDVTILHQTSR